MNQPLVLKNLYDSHVHWLMTGEALEGLKLQHLKEPKDLKQLPIRSEHWRGEWLVGFGWNENQFVSGWVPSRHDLDSLFSDKPVFFIRADGHSSWVNSKALQLLGFEKESDIPEEFKKFIPCEENGLALGLLRESAHMKVYSLLPPMNSDQMKFYLLAGQKKFLQTGFTHIRDMTTSAPQWSAALQLFSEKKLFLHVEHNFTCENGDDLDRAFRDLQQAKKNENTQMKARGLKIFLDGSLGSETAYLSQNYLGSSKKGNLLWSSKEVKELVRRCWSEGFDVSVHSIGDESTHELLSWIREVSAAGFHGRLHLEHVQILRPETIKLMKPLHITCHLQPCHWLSDRHWFRQKIGDLYQWSFPWEALRRAGVPFYFGSDSPIEESSWKNTLLALRESRKDGIPALESDPWKHCIYPRNDSFSSETEIQGDQLRDVRIDGKSVLDLSQD